MRKYQTLFTLLVTACLFGCQKELAPIPLDSPLVKVVSVSSADSIVSEFQFDGSGKLAQEKITTYDGAITDEESISIVRDGNGRAIRTVYSYDDLNSPVDITNYSYDGNRVKHGILNFDFNGIVLKDSIAFSYANRVSKTVHYLSAVGVGAIVDQYNEYTYDSRGNLSQVKAYSTLFSGDPELTATINIEYDDKINPWYSNDDVLIEYLGRQYISPNNMTKISVVAADPAYSYEVINTYEYGPDKRPIKGTSIFDGITYQVTYIYQ